MGNLAFGLSSASSGRSGELGVKESAGAAKVALELGRPGPAASFASLVVVEFEAGDDVTDLCCADVD